MPRIFKYPLRVTDSQYVSMPEGATILSAKVQGSEIVLWAIVDKDNLPEDRTIAIVGTGEEFPQLEFMPHIDTVQLGDYVWHIFDATEN